MRKMTAAMVLLLGLNVFFCLGQERNIQVLMSQNEADTPRKQLKEILKQFQDVYKVNLLFEAKVEGLTSSYQINPGTDINHALRELLAPFQLTYVRLNNKNYIIKSVQTSSSATSSFVSQETVGSMDSTEPRAVTTEKNSVQPVDPPTEVKGFVSDESGKPIVGATVIIKGTSIGCQTDNTGGFSIRMSEAHKPVLMVSYIGMKMQEINVKNKSSIRVFMEKADRQNEDIVVVGYGRQAKKDVVTAVSTIKAEEIMQENTVNLGNALQGKVNGAVIVSRSGQPGNNRPYIMVRGNNPKYSPLIVIDGVPRYQDNGNAGQPSSGVNLNGLTLDDINPDEVESISVLKDNAATAIYGTKGAGGVIIIETKRGKIGKPQFNFSTNIATSAPCRFPTLLNAYEYAQVENENYMNTGYTGGKPKYTDSVMNIIHYGLDPYTYGNVDLYNMIVSKPTIQQNSLSVSGGSDAVRYYLNGSYANEGGLVAAYNYKRYTVQSNLDIKLTNDLKLAINTGFVTSTMNGVPSGTNPFSTIIINSPLTPVYNKDGSLYTTGLNSNRWASTQSDLAGYQRNNNNNISVQANLQYAPAFVKGLAFRLNNNINYNAATYTSLIKYYDGYKPDATSATGYVKTSGTSGFAGPGSNNLREQIGTGISYNTDYGFDYNKRLGLHSIGITALGTHYYSTSRQNQTYRDGIIDGIESINNGRALNQQTGGSSTEDGRVGGVLRASYNYGGKYYVEYSMRADASDHFPKAKRWGYFPGGAISWRLSEEKFIKKNLPFIQDLKIRASLGMAGIDNLDAYSYFYNYSIATTGSAGGAGYSFGGTYQPSFALANDNLPNQDVTWGKSVMQNIGIDFALWKGLLSGSFDAYRKDVSGIQIENASATPLTFGIGGPKDNLGKEFYSGFEASLSNNTKLGRDMSLQTTFNYSYAHSRVVYAGEGPNVPDWQKKQGHAVAARSYYKALGIFQSQKEISDYTVKQDATNNSSIKPGDTKYADLDGSGAISDTDRVWYDNTNLPPYTWGLNMTYKYKNFSLNVMFQGAGGNWVQFVPGDYTAYGRDHRWNPAHTAEENANALYPRLAMDNQANNSPSVRPNTLYLNKGDYIRFKNLSIGYNLPNKMIKKAGLSTVKITAAVMNLASFSKFKDIDPEAANSDINNGGYYPVMRNYSIGLNVGF